MNLRLVAACVISLAVGTTTCPVTANAQDDSWIPDRRRAQFQNDPGYAVLPYVFDLPGIGTGYGILGAVNNIAGTYMDVAGTCFEGDVSGQAVGIESIHLIPKTLILDIGGANISQVTFQSYSQRGMNTDKNDLFLIKDVRTAIQVAPFHEIGSVADQPGDLWSESRSSYGVGVRGVTASGLIYRLDFAGGDEGFQPSIFLQYPWEL